MARPYKAGDCTANDLYDLFNGRYFRNGLPKIPVRWSDPQYGFAKTHRNFMGYTYFLHEGKGRNLKLVPEFIALNPKYKTASVIWVQTLLHEMVHVKQAYLPRRKAHGHEFNREMKRLANKGAFNGLW